MCMKENVSYETRKFDGCGVIEVDIDLCRVLWIEDVNLVKKKNDRCERDKSERSMRTGQVKEQHCRRVTRTRRHDSTTKPDSYEREKSGDDFAKQRDT
jgi:hypothetical protein